MINVELEIDAAYVYKKKKDRCKKSILCRRDAQFVKKTIAYFPWSNFPVVFHLSRLANSSHKLRAPALHFLIGFDIGRSSLAVPTSNLSTQTCKHSYPHS